jgi:hypothetical protein
LPKLTHDLSCLKSGPNIWATSVIKTLTKINIHPTGENSANLVTLHRAQIGTVIKQVALDPGLK